MKAAHPYNVIKAPVLSEESSIQTSAHNKYTFKVDPRANKRQIKEAVEQQWPDVHVTAVNTMNYDGKTKRRNMSLGGGLTAKWKKAIVTLRSGDKIDLI
jgi:large subunit ribosomal protein L23